MYASLWVSRDLLFEICYSQVANSPYFSLMEMSATTTIHTAGVQVFHQDMLNSSFQPGMVIMPYSPLAGFPLFSHGWEQAKAEALVLAQNNDRYWYIMLGCYGS